MMESFIFFVAVYGMPFAAFIFFINMIRIIDKIKRGGDYKANEIWAGLSFALIVWTFAVSIFLANGG